MRSLFLSLALLVLPLGCYRIMPNSGQVSVVISPERSDLLSDGAVLILPVGGEAREETGLQVGLQSLAASHFSHDSRPLDALDPALQKISLNEQVHLLTLGYQAEFERVVKMHVQDQTYMPSKIHLPFDESQISKTLSLKPPKKISLKLAKAYVSRLKETLKKVSVLTENLKTERDPEVTLDTLKQNPYAHALLCRIHRWILTEMRIKTLFLSLLVGSEEAYETQKDLRLFCGLVDAQTGNILAFAEIADKMGRFPTPFEGKVLMMMDTVLKKFP